MSTTRAMRAMPGLPGAACISGSRGLAARVSTSACSRPPPPTTITFTPLSPDPLYYRLIPLRPDADHAQGSPHLGLDEPDEVPRGVGKVPTHPAPSYVLPPTWELLVDGTGVVQVGLVHRVSLDPLAVYLVADADLYLLDRGEHVQQRDGEVCDPVERRRPPDGREVEPTRPPAAPRRRAVLAPDFPYGLGGLVEELRGHWPVAHPGRVRFRDPDDVLDAPRRDAGSHYRPSHRGVGGGHEGVGPVVVVEECGLSSFEQYPLSALEGVPQDSPSVRDHRLYELPEGEQPRREVGDVVGLLAVDVLEDGVLLAQGRLELGLQDALVEDILGADAVAGDLVLVGRPYAAVRGPDPGAAERDLPVRVERDVVGHYEVRPAVHLEPAPDLEAPRLQRTDLLGEHLGVDHHPVPDGADHPFAHDAGRDEV